MREMDASMKAIQFISKASAEELASGHRMSRHLAIGLKALCVPFALCGIILTNGDRLSEVIKIDSSSILFWLWPFNRVYLQQFANSPYGSAEIKWFFTVVSCSNAIWLIFLCWKLVFELSRGDVKFPPGRTPVITQFIVRGLIVACVILVLGSLVGFFGFSTQGDSLFAVSFKQSITVGAIKVVMMTMFFLYVGGAFILEFGGLGLRYLLSKRFGYFVAETTQSTKRES